MRDSVMRLRREDPQYDEERMLDEVLQQSREQAAGAGGDSDELELQAALHASMTAALEHDAAARARDPAEEQRRMEGGRW